MRKCVVLLAAILILGVSSTLGQSTSAGVNGRVRDTSGGVVVGAKVEITNYATGVQSKTETNKQGLYSFPNLPPANYSLRVSKDGFKTFLDGNIILNVQAVRSIDVTLTVGSVSNTVTVVAGAPSINTSDGSVGTVLDRQFIKNLPLNGRTLQALIALVPGVVTVSSSGKQSNGQFSIDGQRSTSNSFTVDGLSANVGVEVPGTGNFSASGNLPATTVTGTTQPMAPIDDLQEFKVQTSTFSAEYGTRPGGQIAFATRSGGSKYHGNAFEYFRNTIFDANDWFADSTATPRSPEHQNDFGGTLGGPITIPDVYNGDHRTFFFFSYEGLRLRLPEYTLTNVPDLCLRGMAPATGPTSCVSANNPALTNVNTLSTAAPGVLPLLNAFPLQNGPEEGNGTADFTAGYSNPASLNSTSIRIDEVVNSKLTLFTRYARTPSMNAELFNSLSSNTITTFASQAITAGATWVPSARVANDLRVSFNDNNAHSSEVFTGIGGAIPPPRSAIIPAQFDPGAGASGLFDLNFTSNSSAAVPSFFLNDDLRNSQRQFEIVDGFSYTVGTHHLKFGADYRRLTPNYAPELYSVDGIFYDASDLMAGVAPIGTIAAQVARHPLFINFGVYGQDTWNFSTRLTLSLGLRWEVNPAPTARDATTPVALTEVTNLENTALAPMGTPLWFTTYKNFAPRLGVAYQLSQAPGWQTVLRGGFGIFYDTGNDLAGQSYANTFPWAYSTYIPNMVYPFSAAQVAPGAIPVPLTPPYPVFFAYDPHLQLPYTWQWSAAVEQSLGKSQTLTATYVGNAGRRLLQGAGYNARGIHNPDFTLLMLTNNNATSDYNALQVQYQRRLSRGLQALVSYTWAHALDWDSGSFSTYAPQHGNAVFDIRHTLSAAATYDIPVPGKAALARAILGHWSIDSILQARSAPPLDITSPGIEINPFTGIFSTARPDVVPGIPWYISSAQCAQNYNIANPTQPIGTCPGGRSINNTPNDISLTQGVAAGCKLNAAGTAVAIARGPFCTAASPSSGSHLGRNQVRALGAWQVDFALHRELPLREGLSLIFRAEAFNLFNHPNFGSLQTGLNSPTFGQPTEMLNSALGGGLNELYQIGGPRSLQFSLNLRF